MLLGRKPIHAVIGHSVKAAIELNTEFLGPEFFTSFINGFELAAYSYLNLRSVKPQI